MNKLRGKTMNLSIISLIVLVIVVAIGFIKKVNLGFLSIGVAFFLGTVGGMSAKEIAAGLHEESNPVIMIAKYKK